MIPDGVGAHARRVRRPTGPPRRRPADPAAQWLNQTLNNLVLDEDIDLVDNVQQGLQTRGYECGPLSRREDAVAWFADRVRADLAPDRRCERTERVSARRAGRARASGSSPPPSARSPARASTASGSRGSRWTPASRPSLVHYHFASRDALLAEALDYSYAHAGDARISSGELPAASHAERLQSMIDQCLPTIARAARGLGAVGRAVAARGAPSRSCGRSPRSCTRGCTRGSPTRSPRACTAASSQRCDPDEVTDRVLALLDGYGVRTLIGDSAIPLERARARGRARRWRATSVSASGSCLRPRIGSPGAERGARGVAPGPDRALHVAGDPVVGAGDVERRLVGAVQRPDAPSRRPAPSS